MLKLKSTILAVMLIFLLPMLAVAYPQPNGHVNDFANVLSQSEEKILESKLRDFEKQTSIEIAVITTPTLDGQEIKDWTFEIASRWGVGKKGKDNGIVICIAPNHRKYYTAVGYGLESEFPDSKIGALQRDIFPPYFRAGDYYGGLKMLVDSIISTLGTKSLAERAEEKARIAEEKRLEKERDEQAFKKTLLILGSFVLLGLLILTLIIIGIRMKKLTQFREKIKKELEELNSQMAVLQGKADKAVEVAKGFPRWAQAESSDTVAKAMSLLDSCGKKLNGLGETYQKLSLNDTRSLEPKITAIKSEVEEAEGMLNDAGNLPAKVKKFQEGAYASASELTTKISELEKFLSRHASKGFIVGEETELAESVKLLQKEAELPSERDPKFDYRPAYNTLQKLLSQIQATKGRFESKLTAEESTRGAIQGLPGKVQELKVKHEKQLPAVDMLKSSSPSEVWKSVVDNFSNVPFVLSGVEKDIGKAEKLNSMHAQKFLEASEVIGSAKDALERAKEAIDAVPAKLKEIVGAKSEVPKLLESAEIAVNKAVKKSKDSDVSSSTKRKAKDAKAKLEAVKADLNASKVNWVLIASELPKIEDQADEAYRKAKKEIDDAEDDRSSWSSSSTGISIGGGGGGVSSGGGGDSGGFGGFGGGSFGGGGSGGSW
ncbi:MAG: TPM domain-containing protein [Nanoarchaeota archaeon]|nr:TPM domain-containing protein [Nanoarchaeota archaeon]